MTEMLERVPRDEYLTTPEIQHVFGGVHRVTVSKWVAQEKLPTYRTGARGRANLFHRDDVIALIKRRFTPRPSNSGRTSVKKGKRAGGPVRKTKKARS